MTHDGDGAGSWAIAGVLDQMQERLDALPASQRERRVFLSAYKRTTAAVGAAIEGAGFEDPEWVERWDVVFARLYLAAHDADLAGGRVPRPWRLAFDAPDDLQDLRHLLLGINAHVNYDLPQALIGVISEADFTDPVLMDRRRRDHERIDGVLANRVAAEDAELPPESFLDRLLTPLNRLGTKRFLRGSRRKVWHNTVELNTARLAGPAAYAARLAESRCSAPRRSSTSSHRARWCSGWPSPASGSRCPRPRRTAEGWSLARLRGSWGGGRVVGLPGGEIPKVSRKLRPVSCMPMH